MDILIVGAGAIGLFVAARLAQASEHRVALLARSNAAQLAADGIRISENGATTQVRNLEICTDVAALPWQPELTVLAVKSFDTASVLPALTVIDPANLLTLQNGIGNEEQLIAHFGPQRVLSGAITTSVEITGPGQITITKRGGIGLAAVAGQPIAHFVQPFDQAGFETHSFASYQSLKWSKALLNMLGNASSAILDMTVAEVYADDRLIALERRAFREALAVMDQRGLGVVSLPRYPAAALANAMRYAPPLLLYPLLRRTVAGGRGGKLPSLLIELRKGNQRSEGQFLNGAVAAEAARIGVAAPVNAALWRTLDRIAQGQIPWAAFRGKVDRLLAEVGTR